MELIKFGKLLKAFAWILAGTGLILALLPGSQPVDLVVLAGLAALFYLNGWSLTRQVLAGFWTGIVLTLLSTGLLGWRTAETIIRFREMAKSNQMALFPSTGVEAILFGILTLASLLIWMVSLSQIRSVIQKPK
ncbi:MAG: hypothetical protein L6Q77_11405 [Bacteroidetes bacterium]|nr:hypothetical protein [Bacteroidota bacterium]